MDWIALAGFTLAVLSAAATGAIFAPGEWYKRLDRPSWTPPDWAFPVVWTILYTFMVIAALRVAGGDSALVFGALGFWAAQLVLNALWSPVFFGAQRIGGALVVVSALWVAVLATLILFLQVDLIAGLLFVPYLAWVSTAAALNYSIWRRNRPQLSAA